MATSSERSPPPFPDTEDQDVLDSEAVRRDSDEDDLFLSAVSPIVVRFTLEKPPIIIIIFLLFGSSALELSKYVIL